MLAYRISNAIFCYKNCFNQRNNTEKTLKILLVQFIFYSFLLYVVTFPLFSNISKTVFGFSHIWFCREFQTLSLDSKKYFNQGDNIGEISIILRG